MSKTWCSGGSEKAGPDSSTKPLYIGYRVRVKSKRRMWWEHEIKTKKPACLELCTTKHVRLLLGEDGFKDPRTDPRDPHPEELQFNYEQFPKTIVQLQRQYN